MRVITGIAIMWVINCGAAALLLAHAPQLGITVDDYLFWSTIAIAVTISSLPTALFFAEARLVAKMEEDRKRRKAAWGERG